MIAVKPTAERIAEIAAKLDTCGLPEWTDPLVIELKQLAASLASHRQPESDYITVEQWRKVNDYLPCDWNDLQRQSVYTALCAAKLLRGEK